MLRFLSTVLAALAAVLLAAGLGGTIATATTTAAAPKTLGFCAKQAGGAVRMLEPKNTAKSQFGACKKGETRVQLPTTTAKGPKGDTGPAGPKGETGKDGKDGRGLDGAPFKMTFTGNGPWSCSWKADTETLACITP
ncbi:hypothetical protein [Nonomuraea wenchangensis]|uniref:Collagen triple helix repeat-containing protein n=1 Tax=Nonomuraea wenchangensis TaxID=568860 RepID=A0A1I0LTT2_9ACTN|nr:hypothetical protein [Nonomuraea wenchangensis]SEU46657.1 hypothetical protein SAMN05421811_127108 [Nonomuraea wenchangensis]